MGITVSTLADFLEVDAKYESCSPSTSLPPRRRLNYVVVKSWDAADEGLRAFSQTDASLAGRPSSSTPTNPGANSWGDPSSSTCIIVD